MTAIRRGFSLVLRDCPQDKYEVQLPRTTKVGFGMSINQDGVVTKWRDPDPRPVVMEVALPWLDGIFAGSFVSLT